MTILRRVFLNLQLHLIMGDKSPKSVNKVSKQKQVKAASATEQKKQAIAAQKTPSGKKK